ncbi:MAG: DUF763 domain-containing protein [Thermanaeromonas sp.]|uniref:DUF763 domain-containing protein n=1 Tax=Thermanaeromonas sp. TaxID=2003697 RepID=UPI00243D8974|nr:DUF763 domain-containing protein [Thermanaeromonas sp.]MCG0278324.1 DUF763 domain-containing protein [Thermanaeromonas sp.]
MRTGIASLPLHGGHCPPWLFERMKRLAIAIIEVIVQEFGPHEVLRRLSDPFWFQAFGCVLGFDWHSSGLTTTVCGALKEGLRGRERDLGLVIAGGKGRTSRQTPLEIATAADRHALPLNPEDLIFASRMAAKVDNTALQDGYQLYHHVFIFTFDGQWAVVQQGMNEGCRLARRYHWLGEGLKDFVCDPHAAVCCDRKGFALNLVAKESEQARKVVAELAREKPEKVVKEYRRILEKRKTERDFCQLPSNSEVSDQDDPTGKCGAYGSIHGQLTLWDIPGCTPQEYTSRFNQPSLLELPFRHDLPQAEYLNKALLKLYASQPADFISVLGVEGVGPKTLRALALVSEVAFGAPASFRDPVKYSFSHGGKDGHPYPVDRKLYDRSIAVLEKALTEAKIGRSEKMDALRRLAHLARL